MTVRLVRAAALLAGLGGCAVGPDYRRPDVTVPAAWTEAPPTASGPVDTSLDEWWKGFGDPTLDALIRRAVASNLDLKIAAARVREARAAGGIAASGALPRVGAQAGLSRTSRSEAVPPFRSESGSASPFGPREQSFHEAGFDASWELDVFGGVRRSREAAVAETEAAEEAHRDVLVTLLAEVARNYVMLRGAQHRLEILDDSVASHALTLALVGDRLWAGLATDLDRSRAEELLASTEAERPPLRRSAGQAMHRLEVLLGENPGSLAAEMRTPSPVSRAVPAIPPALPSDLLSRRPDLRRAERELAAATARIGAAKAELYPKFSIVGSVGNLSDGAPDLVRGVSQYWSVLPGVRWPVFSGGRIRANVRVQTARQEEASKRYEQAILTALEEVENGFLACAEARRRGISLRESVAAARRILELTSVRFTAGVGSFLPVLDARRGLDIARDELVQSEMDESISLIASYKSLGGGWPLEGSRERTSP